MKYSKEELAELAKKAKGAVAVTESGTFLNEVQARECKVKTYKLSELEEKHQPPKPPTPPKTPPKTQGKKVTKKTEPKTPAPKEGESGEGTAKDPSTGSGPAADKETEDAKTTK